MKYKNKEIIIKSRNVDIERTSISNAINVIYENLKLEYISKNISVSEIIPVRMDSKNIYLTIIFEIN